MNRQKREAIKKARIAALRAVPRRKNVLPMARLSAGLFADFEPGMRLLGIDAKRYESELRRGVLDVFRLRGHIHALEIPVGREGPETDFLEAA